MEVVAGAAADKPPEPRGARVAPGVPVSDVPSSSRSVQPFDDASAARVKNGVRANIVEVDDRGCMAAQAEWATARAVVMESGYRCVEAVQMGT